MSLIQQMTQRQQRYAGMLTATIAFTTEQIRLDWGNELRALDFNVAWLTRENVFKAALLAVSATAKRRNYNPNDLCRQALCTCNGFPFFEYA